METYVGHVRTPTDAIILFEACRIGLLPRVQRRLSEKERQSIKSGSVFVWDEREAGMRRWTDGKSWSASRVSGSFLTYREMEGKRSNSSLERPPHREGLMGLDEDSDGGPNGYRYKPDGLIKQSFSIKTQQGQHLHLISYYSRSHPSANHLMQPSSDQQLRHIRPEKGMYPDSTVADEGNPIPAITRGPMSSPGYPQAPPHVSPYGHPMAYNYPPPAWAPPSPMHTPPPHGAYPPYYQQHCPPQRSYPAQSPMQPVHYPPPPGMHYSTPYDRPPPVDHAGVPVQQYSPPSAPAPYPPPPSQYHHGYTYAQPQGPHHEPVPPHAHPGYDPKHAHDAYAQHAHPSDVGYGRKDQRQDSHHSTSPPLPQQQQPYPLREAPAPLRTSSSAPMSGQTIPSISAMLNGGDDSRSPGGTLRAGLQDIPSHKLGFEANRDVQALRDLDKTTFKQYLKTEH